MSNYINLARGLRESVKHYKQVSDLADLLENVGVIEQTNNELTKAVALKRQELNRLNDDTQKARQALDNLKTNTVKDAQAKADKLIDQANAEFKIIIDDARGKSNHIVKTAQEQAEAIIQEAQTLQDNAVKLTDKKQAELQALNNQVVLADKDLQAKQAKLNEVNKRIQSILGGND